MNRTFTLQVTENELEQLIFSVYLNKKELEDSIPLNEKVKDYDENSKKRYLEFREKLDLVKKLYSSLIDQEWVNKYGDKS